MPPLAFTLAITAAVLHAFWNILLARARDPESATAVALVAAVIVFAPVAALRFDAEWAVWPFIVVTSMLQLLYFALLATAYRKAELSFVYPVARGVAPAIVLVVSVVALGDSTRPRRWSVSSSSASVCCSSAACGAHRFARVRVRPRDRLCDRVVHAPRQAGDHPREPCHLSGAEHDPGGDRVRGGDLAVKGRVRVRAELGASAVLAGILSFAAYALVLAALERASAASVAAVRETSVVMATAFAAVLLHERVSRSRLAGSALVVCGIALLALR